MRMALEAVLPFVAPRRVTPYWPTRGWPALMTMALLVVARAMLPVVRKPLTGVAPALAAP
jgi:hypothetical protein